ncbi:MAG: hypothetical protein AB7L66_23065, partial [Gemmatimonadales bacterium]
SSSAHWAVGQELSVSIRVNASGGPRSPMTRGVMCEVEGQRNYAVNFDTPQDVASIAGLTVTVQPGTGIRGAVLFRRRHGLASPGAGGMAIPAPAPMVGLNKGPVPLPIPEPPPAAPTKPKITLKRPDKS